MVDNILVSDDLKDTYFACKLTACKGNCCVAGDAGAPLEEEEISILEDELHAIIPYMNEAGKAAVQQSGVFEYDVDGIYVTPLVNDEECAFVFFEDGISFCAIERAYTEGKINYQKPISCHLYPLRMSHVGAFEAINYHKWDVCAPALIQGRSLGDPLYKYLRVPLIRKYGRKWYEKLLLAMKEASA